MQQLYFTFLSSIEYICVFMVLICILDISNLDLVFNLFDVSIRHYVNVLRAIILKLFEEVLISLIHRKLCTNAALVNTGEIKLVEIHKFIKFKLYHSKYFLSS